MKQGWEVKKLNDVCSINYGTRVVQKKDGGSIYPVYGGGGATFKMDKYNREDCLIVSRFAMSPQCVRYVQGKFFLNDSGLSIDSMSSVLNQNFLDKHIIALNDKIYSLGKGAAQRNLDVNALKNIDIHYPMSLVEQEKIVAELDCLSGIIEKKKQQLKEYDALAQSIFYEMFGNPIDNEKGWDNNTIGNIANFYNGAAHEGNISENGKYCVVNSKFVSTNGLVRKYCDSQISPLYKNDIVMVMSDVPNGKTLAKCYIVEENDTYTLNQRICAFRNYDLIPTFFFYCLNRHPYYLSFDNGNSQTNLRRNEVLACPIIIPPLALQQEFASKIEAIEKQKELIKQSIAETETLFNSRMDYYFN